MKRSEFLAAMACAVLFFAFAPGCSKTGSVQGRLSVVASFDAMAEFSKAVGGDHVQVHTLTPAGIEPHEFEPKAQDMAILSKAAVFVYNGMGMEAWAEKAIAAANNKKLIAVEASAGVDPIGNDEPEEVAEHGAFDPHVWLSLSGAAIQAKNIAEALGKADPKNAQAYAKNLDAYVTALNEMRTEYGLKFQGEAGKSFVTGHAAFAYFCRDFDLSQKSVENVFAEGEPSAKALAELVDYCRKEGIKTVFVEEMVSPDVSKTLASEVGAKVETIATLEGPEEGKSYLDRQRENLDKVYDSLKK